MTDIKKSVRSTFDKPYYYKFYENPETRAVEQKDVACLVDFILHYLEYLGIRVGRILDIGCGLGMCRQALEKCGDAVEYAGVETSEYLCRQYGWKHDSVTSFTSRSKYDLVICRSVFQYLKTSDARTGIRNLARLCRGALYLEVVTKEDWNHNCDKRATDGAIHLRSADWYRKEIRRYFTSCGGGVFIPNDSPVVLYELEKA